MIRSLTLAVVFLLALLVANVHGEEKKPADEVTTLRLRILFLERQSLALKADLDVLKKTHALDTALSAAAAAAKLDLREWSLDLATAEWVRKGEKK